MHKKLLTSIYNNAAINALERVIDMIDECSQIDEIRTRVNHLIELINSEQLDYSKTFKEQN